MEQKVCKHCGILKSVNEFGNHKLAKDGLQQNCKICQNIIVKNYFKTKDGLILSMYLSQKKRSIAKNYPLPSYTRDELRLWLFEQPLFHKLFFIWENTGYQRALIPSCDRISDNLPYTFNNLQLMTYAENLRKHCVDVRNGINNKRSKSVSQYTMDGVFVKEYYSQSQAYRETNIHQANISNVCIGKANSAGGFIWMLNK